MSFDISPVERTQATASAATASQGADPAAKPTAVPQDAVAVDTLSASPPPEVLAAIAAADHTYHQLAAAGRHLAFAVDEHTGQVKVEVQDLSGGLLSTLTPSQALEVAGGAPLPAGGN